MVVVRVDCEVGWWVGGVKIAVGGGTRVDSRGQSTIVLYS